MDTKSKTRKVIQSGNALIISLPADFCRKAGIRRGDVLGLTYNTIVIIGVPRLPPKEKEDA